MTQLLTFICDSEKRHNKKYAYYQCACGNQVEKRKDEVNNGKTTSCGCMTKDGRNNLTSNTKHPLYGIYTARKYHRTFGSFELFVAELGQAPFEGATVGPLIPGTEVCPGNVGWNRPIFTHGEDRITTDLFMPLDPKEFGQYNVDAYKEETKESSWIYSLNALTKQYDQLREQYQDDPVALERHIEELSRTEAIDKFDRQEQKVLQSGRAFSAHVWQQFKAKILPLIVERMKMVHASAISGRSGIHHNIVSPILRTGFITPEEIALIGLNSCMDALGDGTGFRTPLVRVYKNIGQRIDDQCYLRWWETAYPSEFQYVDKWILHSNSGYHYKMRKAVSWINNRIEDHPPNAWKRLSGLRDDRGRRLGDEPLIHIGEWVFQAIQSVCMWFTAELLWSADGKSQHKQYFLGLSMEGMKWRNLIDQGIKELLFEAQPMCVEPMPWNEEYHKLNHGGYLVPQPLNFSKLIHGHRGTTPSPEAIRALNKVQSVGYRINPFMYHTLSALLGKNIKIGEKFICHERLEYMEQNFPDIDPAVWNLPPSSSEYKSAKNKIARVYGKCKQNELLQDVPYRTLKTAAKFLNYDRIYFPAYFDNRLRIYYLHTSGLHPQGANYAKSLLLFADPLPVTDENRDAVERDLLISLANCYGNDKISLDDRVTFAKDLVGRLENVAKEPLASGHMAMWTGVSEPFTFLATLRQYHEVFTWKTRNTVDIACGRDATSSGLQLMSALMREEKAMRYTNVIPGDKPQDLYGEVARHAQSLLNNDNWLATQMEKRKANAEKKALKDGKDPGKVPDFTFGLDTNDIQRGTTKRAVMTDSYGASWQSKNEYISEELMKLETQLGRKVTLAEKATVTTAIIDGQSQAFPICDEIKRFFKTVVIDTVGNRDQNVIKWTTPCGSEIQQRYSKSQAKQIKTFAMGGASVYQRKDNNKNGILLTIQEDTPEINSNRHFLGISPNVHHTYDAYICQQSILEAGTDVIATCHDCFYARPGEVRRMVEGVKVSFHRLVTSDVLQDLLRVNEVEGLLVPRFGDDDLLDNFMDSDYCFH